MVKKYRKKPVVIEAVLWDGKPETEEFLNDWMGTTLEWKDAPDYLVIPTLEGDHIAKPVCYIIKGVAGEFYPCNFDIFGKTYEEVEMTAQELLDE